MYKIKESIIVEGVYDKIRLSNIVEGIILPTGGFAIFTNEAKQETIKNLAKKTGIVILTDADSAGFQIRNFVKQLVPSDQVKHAYIPDVEGKERRKRVAGKEGLIGVEGIRDEILVQALRDAGCELDGEANKPIDSPPVTKADFYALGLTGSAGSEARRTQIAVALGVSTKISANMLLDVVNRLMSFDDFVRFVDETLKDEVNE